MYHLRFFIIAALFGLFLFSAVGIAQDSLNVRRLDQIMYTGGWHFAQDVVAVGDRAYIARRQGGIALEDISELDSLIHIGDFNPPC